MKKLVITVAILGTCLGAFAQGKVRFVNDAASLITLTTDTTKVAAADQALAGQAVGNTTALPSGVTLVAGLYAGTSSTSLSLVSTVVLNSGATPAGFITGLNTVLPTGIPGIASGTAIGASTPWFQVKVWDSAFASYETGGASYLGQGALFQANPGPSAAYTFLSPPGVNSSWVEAPIVVAMIPEPTTLALFGLGAASLLVMRRRK